MAPCDFVRYEVVYELGNTKHVPKSTLSMIFSVTYYLELHDYIVYILYISYFTNKYEIGSLDILEH